MSAIMKLSGSLALGPGKQDTNSSVHRWIRVGSDFINYQVKIPLALASLLREGQHYNSIWLARVYVPTPLLCKTTVYMVYAIERDGVLHNAVEDAVRSWRTYKWLLVVGLLACTFVTLLLYIWPLFLINSFRMALANLPIEEMRREPT